MISISEFRGALQISKYFYLTTGDVSASLTPGCQPAEWISHHSLTTTAEWLGLILMVVTRTPQDVSYVYQVLITLCTLFIINLMINYRFPGW